MCVCPVCLRALPAKPHSRPSRETVETASRPKRERTIPQAERTWKFPRVRGQKDPLRRADRAEQKVIKKIQPDTTFDLSRSLLLPNPSDAEATAEVAQAQEEVKQVLEDRRKLSHTPFRSKLEALLASLPEDPAVRAMAEISLHVELVYALLLDEVPKDRYMEKKRLVEDRLYAYEVEVDQRFFLPHETKKFLEENKGWVRDEMTGSRLLSVYSLRRAAFIALGKAEASTGDQPDLRKMIQKAMNRAP